MAEPKAKLEALKKEAEHHRSDTEKAWAQANIGAAFETVTQENRAKKAREKPSKPPEKP